MLPAAKAFRHKIRFVNFPNVIGFACFGYKVGGVAAVKVRNGGAVCVAESSAVKISRGDVLGHIKPCRNAVIFPAGFTSVLNMHHSKFLGICEPYVLVGVCRRECNCCEIACGQSVIIEDILSCIGVAAKIRLCNGVGLVILKCCAAVNGEIFRVFNLLCKARAFNRDARFVYRLSLAVDHIVVNKNLSAADGYLWLRKLTFDFFVLIVGIVKLRAFVGKQSFILHNGISRSYGNFVFQRGRITFSYVSDIPVDFACGAIPSRSSLADVNIGVSCVINGFFGCYNRRAAESKVDFFAHGVVYNAVLRRDGNAARNAGERFGKLARNIGFVRRNGEIALGGVACAGFQRGFAVGARLKRHGINGGSRGFGLVRFPNGGYAVVAASVSVAANKVAVCIIVE